MLQYQKDVRLTERDFDKNGNPRPGSLLHLFQEAAAEHATAAGAGFDDMIRQNLIWVVTKLKYEMLAPLAPGAVYALTTYPKPKRSLAYQRDYYLHDAAGNELVVASSQWCIINFQTRKVERSSFDYQGEFCNKIAFPEGFERIRLPELTPAGRYVITERDLDRNEHTNNCRYADIVAGVLDRKEAIRRFLIHYAKETRLHDEIQLFQASTEDGRIVVGKLPDGVTVFTAKVS